MFKQLHFKEAQKYKINLQSQNIRVEIQV
jgi:hypothetical protein